MIYYIEADSAGLVFTVEENDKKIRCDTVEDGIYWIKKIGFADNCYFSSSMDFADEYGFISHDGAKKMFDEIMKAV